MAAVSTEKYITSIQASIDNILSTVKTLSEETIRWKPTEDEWSILQIMNHLNEATPYWLNEIDRVLEKPGSEWGRGLNDPDRLEAVEKPAALSVETVIEELKALNNKVSDGLSKINDTQLAQENPHRNFEKFGNKPVSFIIEHFIDEHTAKHYSQIQRNLSKLPESSK